MNRRISILLSHLKSSGAESKTCLSTSATAVSQPFPIPYMARSHGKFYNFEAVQEILDRGPPRFKRGGCHVFRIARFHPVLKEIKFGVRTLDFSRGVESAKVIDGETATGRWNEERHNMYNSASQTDSQRNIHVGLDMCGPVNTSVHAFFEGTIFMTGTYPAKYDYGNVIITKHLVDGYDIWALHGHLSSASLEGKQPGQKIDRGDVVGWLGSREENGGWFPHVHFQLSLLEPVIADMPGVVAPEHREVATAIYVNPEQVLGPVCF